MKIYLLTTLCLLGVSTAQKVTELTACVTKEQNLQMDCKYELPEKTPDPTCQYKRDTDIMGSTNSSVPAAPTFKNRATVTLINGNMCRLNLTGFSEDKVRNYTCIIKQKSSAEKTSAFGKKDLLTCSALSVLLQTSPTVLLTVMLLPVLLERLYA